MTAADRPIAMAFAPDGRLFYAEQFIGNIRVITAEGELQSEPFAQVDAFEAGIFLEWGLMGLALEPDFETNHYVYAFLTESVDPETPTGKPVIVRFTDRDGQEFSPSRWISSKGRL